LGYIPGSRCVKAEAILAHPQAAASSIIVVAGVTGSRRQGIVRAAVLMTVFLRCWAAIRFVPYHSQQRSG
jgi:hypothetical protein